MTSEGEGNHASDDEEDPFRDVEKNASTSAIEELIASKPALKSSILVLDPESVRKKTFKPLKLDNRMAISSPVVEELTQDPDITIISYRSGDSKNASVGTPNKRPMSFLVRPSKPLLYTSQHQPPNANKTTRSEIFLSSIAGSQSSTPVSTSVRINNQSRPPSSLGAQNGPRPIVRPSVELISSGKSPFFGKTLVPRNLNNIQNQYRPLQDSSVYDHPMLQANTHVTDTPSIVVPFVFEQPPKKSFLEFNLENDCNKDSVTKQIPTGSSSSGFESPLGRFITDLGLKLVTNHLQTKTLNELVKKNSFSRSNEEKKLICDLKKSLSENSQLTKDFQLKMHKCKRCNFESDSTTVVDDHERIPHFEFGVFHCPYCQYKHKQPRDMLTHIMDVHRVSARLSLPPKRFQCPNCTFETSTQKSLRSHLLTCAYDPDVFELLDKRVHYDIPGKMLKIPQKNWFMDFSEYWKLKSNPQYSGAIRPVQVQSGNLTFRQFQPNRFQVSSRFSPAWNLEPVPRHLLPLQRSTSTRPMIPINRVITIDEDDDDDGSDDIIVENVSTAMVCPKVIKNYPTDGRILICEICDFLLLDFNAFRDHMFTIHKDATFSEKYHLDPSLSCFKCASKFYTASGLERHLLSGHSLITMFWKEKMKYSQDGGRCMECGKVFHQHIVDHYKDSHKRLFTNSNISYKCKICSSKFGIFDQFVQHFSKNHS